MTINYVNELISVAPQIAPEDVKAIYEQGFKSIVCNRPDGEGADQPEFDEIRIEAEKYGLKCEYMPITSGKVTDESGEQFGRLLKTLPTPVLAYCRTGTRSITLWTLARSEHYGYDNALSMARNAGYDMSGVINRIISNGLTPTDNFEHEHAVVIVGAGAAGIAVASSLKKRDPLLNIAIIDPSEVHYYQPGWTLVGGGVFDASTTVRTTASVIPPDVKWIKAAVAAFLPKENLLLLDGCRYVKYEHLVVCPGIKLDWNKIDGLSTTLGKHGVTSNYRFGLAPYTWELVQSMTKGKALFTQPPMPIKCAGAPQKAMYLSCDYWLKKGVLSNIDVDFCNTGGVLFGVQEYVPALMEYIEKYDVNLNFLTQLVAVDGKNKVASFRKVDSNDGSLIEKEFDMLHVVPPQSPPDFIKVSALVDENGWVDVDQSTLKHKAFDNIYALGDVINAPNAKTAAAARIQAPVVANNLVYDRTGRGERSIYNGYGSCPLTVERGKIVLAEFGYGGKLLNSFPSWFIDGTKPSRLAWYLKEKLLPPIYWKAMLKGKEWMAASEKEGSAN